jgi:hypothetical protein
MFLTRQHLSRRAALRGLGVTLGLPLLDAMVPAQTPLARTAARPKPRFACVEMVHGAGGSTVEGVEKNYWVYPDTDQLKFGLTLEPLEPLKDYITVISNTDAHGAEAWAPAEEGADHFRTSAVFLTATHPKQTEGSDIKGGTSVDQIYAQHFGQDTPLPSIQLCIENVDSTGSCGFNYSCVYSDTISWASPTTPLPMTMDPRMAFENLFGDGGSPVDRASRMEANKSILDAILNDIPRLQKNLSARDKNRLGTYLEDVREVERRIQKIEAYNKSGEQRELPAAPIGVPDSWEEHVKLMFDLQALAFAADVTRVSAFKLSRDTSNRVFPESGFRTPFHTMSHHGESPARILEYAKLNRYHISLLPHFLNKLKNTPDGDGNLLDHSVVLWGCAIGDSNIHNHRNLPFLLAGKANGAIKGGQHIHANTETPMANGLLSVVQKLGVNQQSLGDSNGTFAL